MMPLMGVILISFLSTLSLRRATLGQFRGVPLVGNFYPRSPCGERRTMTITICIVSKFLSTLSLRRATASRSLLVASVLISIHALLAESDRSEQPSSSLNIHFYPRSPCGERPSQYLSSDFWRGYFYPRSPCGERLPEKSESLTTYFISIHALLAESDRIRQRDKFQMCHFYPRSPCGERRSADYSCHSARPISIHALLAESDQR